jgi:hypothetical protein
MRTLTVLIAATLVGCESASRAIVASVPTAPCFAADSGNVAFGTIRISSETHDASGKQFMFRAQRDTLFGWVRDARGQIPPARPLRDIRYDPTSDTVSFWYASGSTTRYIFKYKLGCSELTGIARLFVTDTDSGLVVADTLRRAQPITSP